MTKVLNLRKILTKTVDEKAPSQPFLLSIGERAETLALAYEDRHLTTQEVLAEFERLAQEYIESVKERQDLGLDANEYAIFATLKPTISGVTSQRARAFNSLFVRSPDYKGTSSSRRNFGLSCINCCSPLLVQRT